MDYDVGVSKLLEFIFVKKFKVTEEMTEPDSSFPACLFTNDFPERMRHVLFARQVIISLKWLNEIGTCKHKLLYSHEAYLLCVICACYKEHHCQSSVFDSFISVCSCVRYFSDELLRRTGVDFGDLNVDIVMEFYYSVLKKSFIRCGGFLRLVQYIHRHKYLAWNLDMVDLASITAVLDTDLAGKLYKALERDDQTTKSVNIDLPAMNKSTVQMVQIVLAYTKVELPTLPDDCDSDETKLPSGLNETEKQTARAPIATIESFEPYEEVLPGYSETDPGAKQKEDIPWYDSIVQAVIRYNRLKTSNLGTSDDRLKKAEGILKHLKDTIESLIDVLDEYDEE